MAQDTNIQIKPRDLLPDPVPLWWGVIGAIIAMAVGYTVENFIGAFAGREYFSLSSMAISAVALFYLVTVMGNYGRMKQRGREIPDFKSVSYAETPAWFQRSINKAHSPEEGRQISTLAELHDSIDQTIEEVRSTLQVQVGWVHLLPIGSVAVAFILALANRTANYAYLPLEVASVEAIVCIFFMYAYMSVCNATFECWKLAARHYVKGIAEGRWGKFIPGSVNLGTGLIIKSPPIKHEGEDGGTLGVTEAEPGEDPTPSSQPTPKKDPLPPSHSPRAPKRRPQSPQKPDPPPGGPAPVDPPDGFGPFGDV